MVEILNHSVIHPDKKVKNAVIFLHGYGANGDDLIGIGNLWSNLLPNTIFLSPNAPFKCPWGGSAFQWFELTSISPENIGKGLLKAGPYLNKYVDHIAKEHELNEDKIFFVGFSQGTMMALHHLCKREKKCAGIYGYSGMLYENNNFKNEILSKFPIGLYHGKMDEVINFKFTIDAFQKLKSFGFDISYDLSNELAHGIDDNGIHKGLNFIKKIFNI